MSTHGDSAAASTDAVGVPSRMDRALSRIRGVLEPVGETLPLSLAFSELLPAWWKLFGTSATSLILPEAL